MLRAMREIDPGVLVIIITGYGTVESAVEALKMGAYDFLSKPLHHETLLKTLQKGLQRNRLRQKLENSGKIGNGFIIFHPLNRVFDLNPSPRLSSNGGEIIVPQQLR